MTTTQKRLAELQGVMMLFTRLPVVVRGLTPGPLRDGIWAMPLAGLLVGLTGAGVWGLADRLALPGMVCALLAMAAMTLLTGGLHEDGLADVADGFGGAHKISDKLTIMRDSRVGSYGVLALVFSVGLKAAALAPLIATSPTGAAVIVAAAVWSRTLIGPVLYLLNPARSDGLGAASGTPAGKLVLAALLLGVVICGAVLSGGGGALLSVALLGGIAGAIGVGLLARNQVAGYTGDVLGAVQQMAEIGVILAAVLMTLGT